MALQIVSKNLFANRFGILTHQVNLQGHMGGWLGSQMKSRWDGIVFQRYRIYFDPPLPECRWALGMIQLIQVEPGLWICNLAGQDRYGKVGSGCHTSYPAVRAGLTKLNLWAAQRQLQIYLPFKMGCHAAGGSWQEMSDIIVSACPTAIICQQPKRES